ncbi:MAG: YcjF family protein [Bacillus subtilis]|nr:YcjF family protein [Bacillus subtilis]
MILLLSSVLSLGERVRAVSPILEIGFYVITGFLFLFLIVRPIWLVVFSPTFSMDTLFDEDTNAKRNFLMYRRVAKNLETEPFLSDNQREAIANSQADPMLLKQTLSTVFDETIKKELNKIIVSHAETVFLSTAISQNGRLDMAAVLIINLRLIKELVMRCGFRPSYAALGKLSVNVMSTAIIAETLEGIDFNELFPSSGVNILSEIPLLKVITGSLAQGVGNALLSLRVGIIARNYLFMNLKGQTKKDIRKLAFGEAVLLLPAVLAESLKKLPSRIKSMFEKAS